MICNHRSVLFITSRTLSLKVIFHRSLQNISCLQTRLSLSSSRFVKLQPASQSDLWALLWYRLQKLLASQVIITRKLNINLQVWQSFPMFGHRIQGFHVFRSVKSEKISVKVVDPNCQIHEMGPSHQDKKEPNHYYLCNNNIAVCSDIKWPTVK